ncbi:hypothetical protein [Neorickettsia findlayensis]|uniref:Uncharacterized protein n=1 Tax=Neorickettsia findlayensis TaxID=2686014 RepID=A0A6P1GAP5_9RICK|nr:hypothetical protein [Neorickettsia findlayensis]QHD65001.1 hypothetical protein GP480_00785 [Neorickettsia findlayensis]
MKTPSELKSGVKDVSPFLLSDIDKRLSECFATYMKLNKARDSLLKQNEGEHGYISEDNMPLLVDAIERELGTVVASYMRLKKLQRAFVLIELAALCVFTGGSLSIFVALLRPKLLMSSTLEKTVETLFLCGTAAFFVIFLLRRLALPKVRANIGARITFCEEMLVPSKKRLSNIVCTIKDDCKPSQPAKPARIATYLRFFTLLGGLILEVLLVVDLFHDFGLKKAHKDFVLTVDDILELMFTFIGLLCTSLYLYSYYSQQRNKSAGKADCTPTENKPFLQRTPNTLWVFFGIGILSLGNRVLRGLEGTGVVAISIQEGVLRVGLLFAVLLCLLDIYLTCRTQEDLITSDLADVSVSARVVPVMMDIVP